MTRLSLRLRVAPGAERGCFGIAIVMVRDRSSSHSPHHATDGREYGGLARRCKPTLWSVIQYLTQLPSRALSNSCLRCGQRHRAAGRDVMLCRTLLHSCHGRTARFNPSTTASKFDERLLKVIYFQPFSSGRVEWLKCGYRPLERVPGREDDALVNEGVYVLAFGHKSHVRRGDNESGAGVRLSTI